MKYRLSCKVENLWPQPTYQGNRKKQIFTTQRTLSVIVRGPRDKQAVGKVCRAVRSSGVRWEEMWHAAVLCCAWFSWGSLQHIFCALTHPIYQYCWAYSGSENRALQALSPVSNTMFCGRAMRNFTPFLLTPVNQNFLYFSFLLPFLLPQTCAITHFREFLFSP